MSSNFLSLFSVARSNTLTSVAMIAFKDLKYPGSSRYAIFVITYSK